MSTSTVSPSSTLLPPDPLYSLRHSVAVGFAVGIAALTQGMFWGVWIVAGVTTIWLLTSRAVQRCRAAVPLAEKNQSVFATEKATSDSERRGASFA